MQYLKLFLLIPVFLLMINCQEETVALEEISEDIVYSDSFSPRDWENPVSRITIITGDKNLGTIIRNDTLDPRQRQLINLTSSLFHNLSQNQIKSVRTLFSDSAYNSFKLRISDISFRKEYTIRLSLPLDIEEDYFTLKCKIKFPDQSIIGKLEIDASHSDFKINDFDYDFFDRLKKYALKK